MSLLHPLTVILALSLPWTAQAAESLSRERPTALERSSRNDRPDSSLGKSNLERRQGTRSGDDEDFRPWHEQPSLDRSRRDGKWHCGPVPTPGCRD